MHNYHDVFRSWKTANRINHRRICFKGGGSTEIPETEAQRASSEVALKEFNDYMTTIRPFENKFMEDVSADTTGREAQAAGRVGADIAQKVGTPAINPNMGLNPQSVSDVATTMAGAQVKANQAVKAQKAAGLQSIIDIGRGQANSAQLGLTNLASQSVSEASNIALNKERVNDANMSAGATALGMSAGIVKNMYDDANKK